jgi:hypothetical protein
MAPGIRDISERKYQYANLELTCVLKYGSALGYKVTAILRKQLFSSRNEMTELDRRTVSSAREPCGTPSGKTGLNRCVSLIRA